MTAHSRRQTKTRPVPAPCCARNNNPEGHALCGPLYIYRSDIQSRKLLLLGIDPPRQKRNCSRSAAPLLVSKQRGCKPTAREIAPTEQYIISPFCNEMFVNGASSPQTALLFKLKYALFTFGSSPHWLIRSCTSFWNARTLTTAGATAGVNGPPSLMRHCG